MEIIYNAVKNTVNDIELTRNENIIFKELISKDFIVREELEKITNILPGSRVNDTTISKLRKKLKGLAKITSIRNVGYKIEIDNLKIEENVFFRPLEFEPYRAEIRKHLEEAFEKYKKEVDEAVSNAEEKLKERLGKILWENKEY